jgi:ribosomal protein S27E
MVINSKADERLVKYSPLGTKSCMGICDRDIVFSRDKTVVVCNACKRIVMEVKK